MEESKKLESDLLPFLKLRETEEILCINKYREKKILLLKDLAKYHDPDALPEDIFPIIEKNYEIFKGSKQKCYEYHEIEVLTNYRVIFLGLNFSHLKDDGVTPISDIFHINNFLIWVKNEDIEDCDIKFGYFIQKGVSIILNFYHEEGEVVKQLQMGISCSDYSKFQKVCNVLVDQSRVRKIKIKYQEQQRINSIRLFNWSFNTGGSILLVILGIYIFLWIYNPETTFPVSYIDFGLYTLFVIFFISYNRYWNKTLRKDLETFYNFTEKDFTFYRGPFWSFFVFILCGFLIFGDVLYSMLISNEILSFLASFGSFTCIFGIPILITELVQRKKKKKKISIENNRETERERI